jgi:hypothetical protein
MRKSGNNLRRKIGKGGKENRTFVCNTDHGKAIDLVPRAELELLEAINDGGVDARLEEGIDARRRLGKKTRKATQRRAELACTAKSDAIEEVGTVVEGGTSQRDLLDSVRLDLEESVRFDAEIS